MPTDWKTPENRRTDRRVIGYAEKHWPLIVAIGVLWAAIASLLFLSVRQNQGHVVYALDDTYISMSMAKNLAEYGVWGVTKYEFSSSSSSVLWTLLLALIYYVVGVNELSPLIVNSLCGTLLILSVYLILKRYAFRRFSIFLILVAIIGFSPLPSLIFCGLEHVLHTLLTILFVSASAANLSKNRQESFTTLPLVSLAALVALSRYEGLFLVFVVSVLMVFRNRLREAISVGVAGIFPLLVFGIISIAKGSYLVPNPILLKGIFPGLSSWTGILETLGYNSYLRIVENPHILMLVIASLLLFVLHARKEGTVWKEPPIMIMIFVGTILLHMQFAATGWFYRYEAYLVALGIVVIAVGGNEYLFDDPAETFGQNHVTTYAAWILLAVFVLYPLQKRADLSLISTPRATTNIYEQQYQMGLFLKTFYQGKGIAANDVGAVTFLADIRCLDLWGLASVEVTELKREKRYRKELIDELARRKDAKVAVVYDHWFGDNVGALSPQWIRCGAWKIPHNVVCGGPVVSFYAVDSVESAELIRNLNSFSSRLPGDVVQMGEYTFGWPKAEDVLEHPPNTE